jgi:hypothetical protein
MRCVDDKEATKVLEQTHNGICGGHINAKMLAIQRAGYYWPTMEADCGKYVKKCKVCQEFADAIHAPSTSLHSIISPWPFLMCAGDVIGPFPPGKYGHKFILAFC